MTAAERQLAVLLAERPGIRERYEVVCRSLPADCCDFSQVLDQGDAKLDRALGETEAAAERSGKPPLLFVRRPRRPWLAFLRGDLPDLPHQMRYRDWSVCCPASPLS